MECNVGKIDRSGRLVVGFLLFVLGMYLHVLLIVAVGLLVFLTGVTRFCFLYKLLKINTNCKSGCEKDSLEHEIKE